MPSHNLEAFYYLSKEENFTKAAKRIGLSQPAFSQRILLLEKFLETTLVIREKQKISLTVAGQKLLKYCIINDKIESEFLSDIKNSNFDSDLRGQLRIAGFSSVMRSILIPSLSGILKKNSKLSIQTYTAELNELIDYLKTSKVDFVLHNKELNKEGYVSKFLGFEYNVLVYSNKHPETHILLDHDENDVTTSSYFSKKNESLEKRYLDDVYGLLDGVKMGLGKAIIPKHLIDDKNLLIENPKKYLKVSVYLIYNESTYYTKLQQIAIDSITRHFKKKLPQT